MATNPKVRINDLPSLQSNTGGYLAVDTETGTKKVEMPANPKFTDNNTTYTFAKTENGFSVTPSGGTTQNIEIGGSGSTSAKIVRWIE